MYSGALRYVGTAMWAVDSVLEDVLVAPPTDLKDRRDSMLRDPWAIGTNRRRFSYDAWARTAVGRLKDELESPKVEGSPRGVTNLD